MAERPPLAYTLDVDGRTPVPLPDVRGVTAIQKELRARGIQYLVGRDVVGEVVVSTLFMGAVVDLSDPPLLWETVLLTADWSQIGGRYASWEDARAGHRRAVARLRRARYRWFPGEFRAGCLSSLGFVLCVFALFFTAWDGQTHRWLFAGGDAALVIACGWMFVYWQPRTREARLVRESRARQREGDRDGG